jgi:hypothetical protein
VAACAACDRMVDDDGGCVGLPAAGCQPAASRRQGCGYTQITEVGDSDGRWDEGDMRT